VKADKKLGPGRPAFAEGTARTGVFTIRLSDEERAAIVVAAEHAGKPVTQWARETLLLATKHKA
jgi:predicted HicB family RNase H-like nuclease